jgi:hypothetical protein
VLSWILLGSVLHLYLTRSLLGFIYFVGIGAGLSVLLCLLYTFGLYAINARIRFVPLLSGLFLQYFVTYSIGSLGLYLLRYSGIASGLTVFVLYLILGFFFLHHVYTLLLSVGRSESSSTRFLTLFPVGLFVLVSYAPVLNARRTVLKILPGSSFTWANYSIEVIVLLMASIGFYYTTKFISGRYQAPFWGRFVLGLGLFGLLSLAVFLPYAGYDHVQADLAPSLNSLEMPEVSEQPLENFRKRKQFLKEHTDNPYLDNLEAGDTIPRELESTLNEYLDLVRGRSFAAPNSRFKAPVDTPVQTLSTISLCRAIKLDAINMARSNNPRAGLRKLRTLMNSTEALLKANPLLIDYLVQLACYGIPIDGYRNIIMESTLSADTQQKLLDFLKEERNVPLRNILGETFKNELLSLENSFRYSFETSNSFFRLTISPLLNFRETLILWRTFFTDPCWSSSKQDCSKQYRPRYDIPASALELYLINPSNPLGETFFRASIISFMDSDYSSSIKKDRTKLNCLITVLSGKESLDDKYSKNLLTGERLDESCLKKWSFETNNKR